MIFRRKNRDSNGATAVAEPPYDEFEGTTDELFAEIRSLGESNAAQRDGETERRLVRLRHLAGIRLLDEASPGPQHPEPDASALPEAVGLPEIAAADLTPELLRAGILRDGSVLVRGMIDRDRAQAFADEIERSFAEREIYDTGGTPADGYYDEFEAHLRFPAPMSRPWIKEGGGVLAVDSPMLAFEMLQMFNAAGLPQLASRYLGEPVAISAQKTTLRKAEPQIGGAWHQDGAFMGSVRALNVWLSLSRCGDEAPGLDVVPRRLDDYVTAGDEETFLSYQVSQKAAEKAAGDRPIVRPIFEPGDMLLFDDLCLHQTGSDPAMPNPRFAIESWFFGASAFPSEYAPIAV